MTILATPLPPALGSLTSALSSALPLALGVGLVGGFTSGLCGISPGGALVVLATLLLGAEQHVAQGISLVAQIPPTSLTGIKRYRAAEGPRTLGSLPWLASGFLVGGAAGAIGAGRISSSILQWSYVAYLGILDALLILRATPRKVTNDTSSRD